MYPRTVSGRSAGGDAWAVPIIRKDKSANRELGLVRPGDIFDAFRTKGDTFLAGKVSNWMPLK